MGKLFLPCGNGVGVFDGKVMTVAIVNKYGNKKVGKEKVNLKSLRSNFILFRGIVYFFIGIFCFVKLFFKSLSLDYDKNKNQNQSAHIATGLNFISCYVMFFASIIFGLLYSFLVVGFLPSYFLKIFVDVEENYYLFTFILAVLRVLILYLTLAGLRFMPFMQELYKFNGACGKVQNSSLEDKSFEDASIYQPLNYLNFSFFALLFAVFMISLISVQLGIVFNLLINITIFLLVLSLAYEFLFFIEKSKWKWLRDLSISFSWLFAVKPSITHIEVVRAILIEQKFGEDFYEVDKERISMSTLLAEMQTKLSVNENCDQSDYDWIIANVLNVSRPEVKLIRSVSEKEYRDILRATNRRSKGEPISSIFGFAEFYGLRFDINKKVLTPRMETEILVETVLKKIKETKAKQICDLCTGSGAIAVAIAKNSDVEICAVDISKQALSVAENNAKKNKVEVEFVLSDLFEKLKRKKFDIIVSNPPYIKSGDIEKLDKEVKNFDPKLALDGGDDGFDFYRKIIMQAPKHLAKNGWLFLEIGIGQAKEVEKLMKSTGFVEIKVIKDYNNIERIVYGSIGK